MFAADGICEDDNTLTVRTHLPTSVDDRADALDDESFPAAAQVCLFHQVGGVLGFAFGWLSLKSWMIDV